MSNNIIVVITPDKPCLGFRGSWSGDYLSGGRGRRLRDLPVRCRQPQHHRRGVQLLVTTGVVGHYHHHRRGRGGPLLVTAVAGALLPTGTQLLITAVTCWLEHLLKVWYFGRKQHLMETIVTAPVQSCGCSIRDPHVMTEQDDTIADMYFI